jgi:Rrf2 family protein
MIYLAKCKRQVCPLKEVSNKEGISFDYLEKILSMLEKADIIRSKKGSLGGYSLSRSASKIKIGEIIRALEGERSLVMCTTKHGKDCPLERKCLAKSFWCKIQNALNSVLNSITLSDLIKK